MSLKKKGKKIKFDELELPRNQFENSPNLYTSRFDLTHSDRLQCTETFLNQIELKNFNFRICCICSEKNYIYKKSIQIRKIEFLTQYKRLLHYSNLNDKFENFEYNNKYKILNNLVLNQKGFENNKVLICTKCYNSLINNKLPKNSLANNLFIGDQPESLLNLTFSEEILIAKYRLIGSIFKLKTAKNYDSSQSKLVGNVISFPQDVEGVYNILPNLSIFENIKVILVGTIPPNDLNLKKLFSVNVKKLFKALEWLKNIINCIMILLKNIIYEKETDLSTNIEKNPQEAEQLNMYGLINSSPCLLMDDKDKLKIIIDLLKSSTIKTPLLIHPIGEKPISEFSNPNLIIGLFPTLFPYGTGGFDDDLRKVPITAREMTVHYLNLDCNRFRLHPTFIFFAFNFIQRHEFYKNLSLVTPKNYFKNLSKLIETLTEEDLKESIINVYNTENLGNNKLEKIMSQTFLLAKKIQGSKFNLKSRRNEIRSYIVHKGLPSLYITINPNDLSSPIIKILNENSNPNDYQKLFTDKSINFGSDPINQSHHFNILIENMINYLFGAKNNQNIGIFGKLNGYYGIVEAQARGSLHIHLLVWLVDPIDYNKLNDTEYLDKYLKYLDEIIKCNLNDFYINTNKAHYTDDSNESSKKKNFQNFSEEIIKLALEFNIHKCMNKCKKKPHSNKCRFNFGKIGKPLVEKSYINEKNEVIFKRDHPFINNFNPYILISLKCNHDIQWIESSKTSSLSKMYYITNYITKNGITIYNFLSLVQTYFDSKSITEKTNTNKLFKKLFTSCTAQTEYSACQIGHMLFNYGCDGTYYASDSNITLFYTTYVKIIEELNNDIHPTESNENSDEIIYVNSNCPTNNEKWDYIFRPEELENISLYEFISSYSKKNNSYTSEHAKIYKFLPNHPQYKKTVIVQNIKILIPVISGPNLYYLEREEYFKTMMIIFKPWRNKKDIIEHYKFFEVSFENFKKNLRETNNLNSKYLENYRLLHKAQEDAIYEINDKDLTINEDNEFFEKLTDDYEFLDTNKLITDEFEEDEDYIIKNLTSKINYESIKENVDIDIEFKQEKKFYLKNGQKS
ncbi:unnamed protein product [Brachionus calyciflorus]|uniref:Helitron helicase-like domain-containing protein n=1 Tax=Brachionus calyciflorus TaxID=104777 RepID=A0A813T3A0_9BILA|nr:unnamed protein product [Brachionus calyciflorus]